jgi:hypothetical protein
VTAAGVNPLEHFVRYGRSEGRAMPVPQSPLVSDAIRLRPVCSLHRVFARVTIIPFGLDLGFGQNPEASRPSLLSKSLHGVIEEDSNPLAAKERLGGGVERIEDNLSRPFIDNIEYFGFVLPKCTLCNFRLYLKFIQSLIALASTAARPCRYRASRNLPP